MRILNTSYFESKWKMQISNIKPEILFPIFDQRNDGHQTLANKTLQQCIRHTGCLSRYRNTVMTIFAEFVVTLVQCNNRQFPGGLQQHGKFSQHLQNTITFKYA